MLTTAAGSYVAVDDSGGQPTAVYAKNNNSREQIGSIVGAAIGGRLLGAEGAALGAAIGGTVGRAVDKWVED